MESIDIPEFTEPVDVASILRKFNADKWLDWIEDILNYGIAAPISTLTPDGDVIVDMVNFLNANGISTTEYESAVARFLKQLPLLPSHANNLERLIEATIILKGSKSNATLADIVIARNISHLQGKNDYIKSLALLALARASAVSNSNEIYSALRLRELSEMKHCPSFYGNYLRFVYLQMPGHNFFSELFDIFRVLDPALLVNKEYENLFTRYASALSDRISEYHYRKIAYFYSSFCSCYIEQASAMQDNRLFNEVLKKFTVMLNTKVYSVELDNEFNAHLDEINFGKLLQFLLNASQSYQGKIVHFSKGIQAFAFIFKKAGHLYMDKLIDLLNQHRAYIIKYYAVIPEFIVGALSATHTTETIELVQQLFGTVLYAPGTKVEPTPAEILAILNKPLAPAHVPLENKIFYMFQHGLTEAAGEELLLTYG